jgi:Stigma-specific protein, Stig1
MRAVLAGAVLVGAGSLVACVGDDTVQSEPDAQSFPSDAAPYIDATVGQDDAGDDSGDDATVTANDASDSSFDAVDANACTLDGGRPGTKCSGVCVDMTTDPSNCGACAAVCEAGAVCSSSACDNVAGSLEGLAWYVPCTGGGGGSCSASDPPVVSTTLSGTSGAAYDVTLHFRGVVEEKTYVANPIDAGPDAADAGPTGPVATGTNANLFVTNATPDNDSYNLYSLTITPPGSASPLVAYLNDGTTGITHCWLIDYTVTLPMLGGSTIQLTALTEDGSEISNQDVNGDPIAVPGISFDGGTFNGQFIEMDVVSVTPAP